MASSLSTTSTLPFSHALHALNQNDHSTPRRLTFYASHKLALRGVECRVTRVKESAPPNPTPSSLAKEPHKYFDQAILTVRSGDGGHGTVLSLPNDKPPADRREKKKRKEKDAGKNKVGAYKRDFDGSLILPVGGHGGDVVVYADESKDTLLELHTKSRFSAKRGGNVDSARVLGAGLRSGLPAPALRIPVPVGTVVRRKKGTLLADLAQHGDEVLVARGGQGGVIT